MRKSGNEHLSIAKIMYAKVLHLLRGQQCYESCTTREAKCRNTEAFKLRMSVKRSHICVFWQRGHISEFNALQFRQGEECLLDPAKELM